MDNDYEIIFWYKTCVNKKPWILMMLNIKQEILNGLLYKTLAKYRNMPIEAEDLKILQYEIVANCLENFQPFYKKSFQNFLVQRYIWAINSQMSYFFTNKNKILNYCLPFTTTTAKVRNPFCEDYSRANAVETIKLHLAVLSPKEKLVIKLRMQNFSITDIVACTQFSYNQIDNAYQRAVRKLQKIIMSN